MNLNGVREEVLKDLFDTLEEVFRELEIDYYLIGAVARDIWYARYNKQFRRTKDVDFAVLVGNGQEYDVLREYMKQHKGFTSIRENSFVLISPDGIQVDILPFSEISHTNVTGTSFTNISVEGFPEVYRFGLEKINLNTGHHFKVATLPAIVLLKLIAFDDRPEKRLKDARDIANILAHYFELQTDLIYEKHVDLFREDFPGYRDLDVATIGAIVVGREIKQMVATNRQLQARVLYILQNHIKEAENSMFVRNMVIESAGSVNEMLQWLNGILIGMS
ncbi:nucleotidyl transferase AbiEii/AbiGii toxin family protein [Chitinophaga eiseniae]|uniref:Nucleotidyltransferase n=1 Tax=Chitinophaga eiseniae TaxID=634771 RepID=A0A847SIP6_9BACT|nr:nucleotidyl transferase AbiEii/AbiGii toxin family protein [Chitinophaga eiseniae]NLR81741.1 hypothetical protein [Chitinophaga eiseniae]